jgi:hypothetical protein
MPIIASKNAMEAKVAVAWVANQRRAIDIESVVSIGTTLAIG